MKKVRTLAQSLIDYALGIVFVYLFLLTCAALAADVSPASDLGASEITAAMAVPAQDSDGEVTQAGQGNRAMLEQQGAGHLGRIDQVGSGNQLHAAQHGKDNRAVILQAGSGQDIDLAQTGHNNVARIVQTGAANEAEVRQTGNNNLVDIQQRVPSPRLGMHQQGDGLTAVVIQY